MEDLRSKLRRLATREPSKSLDARVLGVLESEASAARRAAPRIGVGWAIAAAALVGATGFWAGLRWEKAPGSADGPAAHPAGHPAASKAVQVVVGPGASGNPFDFSLPFEGGPALGWKTEVIVNEEASREEDKSE